VLGSVVGSVIVIVALLGSFGRLVGTVHLRACPSMAVRAAGVLLGGTFSAGYFVFGRVRMLVVWQRRVMLVVTRSVSAACRTLWRHRPRTTASPVARRAGLGPDSCPRLRIP